ncbi:GntR family transcriptional regulator [Methylobacterium sp. E-045]|uniref:GntR family transcriptional regulator n=1 Tax=Methylobacterium sp. E-045 TaxID=2836575 RepID=UPI001FBACDAD|nr:GntR family transcriptional regulator [Methylobacterium sp. E-045]MCJ2129273.1 GntR family transcriptional regulator [Methylobacterium sp. E-045]
MAEGKDRAYEVLRLRIVGGHYAPGFHLREEPLAREFEISRTPIRAALRRLVEDGLASADAGQGIHVAEWGDSDVEETFRLRIMLEAHATELAVARGGDELVERLEACNRDMSAAISRGGDAAVPTIQAINRDFHRTLLAFAGSPRLRMILEPMIDMPVVIRSFYLYTPDELLQSLHHHEDLVIAARLRDAELGKRAMQLHLKMSHARVLKHREAWRQRATEGGAAHGAGPRPGSRRRLAASREG